MCRTVITFLPPSPSASVQATLDRVSAQKWQIILSYFTQLNCLYGCLLNDSTQTYNCWCAGLHTLFTVEIRKYPLLICTRTILLVLLGIKKEKIVVSAIPAACAFSIVDSVLRLSELQFLILLLWSVRLVFMNRKATANASLRGSDSKRWETHEAEETGNDSGCDAVATRHIYK